MLNPFHLALQEALYELVRSDGTSKKLHSFLGGFHGDPPFAKDAGLLVVECVRPPCAALSDVEAETGLSLKSGCDSIQHCAQFFCGSDDGEVVVEKGKENGVRGDFGGGREHAPPSTRSSRS